MNFSSLDSLLNTLIWGLFFLYIIIKFVKAIQIVPTKGAYIVERLGKYHTTLGPGFHALIPFIDRVTYVHHLKEETVDIKPQECFTKDNVKVTVDGVMYIAVEDAVKASYGITNYRLAASKLAQTTVRSVIGQIELDKCFEEREEISAKVVKELSEAGQDWGTRIFRYEIQNIVPPESVKEAMEKQVSAERQRRAVIAKSEGEMQSRIQRSEGIKAELINTSEGEKQKKINEAEGKSSAIKSIGLATAQSIEVLSRNISENNGKKAVELLINQKYLGKIGALAKEKNEVILPADLTEVNKLIRSIEI